MSTCLHCFHLYVLQESFYPIIFQLACVARWYESFWIITNQRTFDGFKLKPGVSIASFKSFKVNSTKIISRYKNTSRFYGEGSFFLFFFPVPVGQWDQQEFTTVICHIVASDWIGKTHLGEGKNKREMWKIPSGKSQEVLSYSCENNSNKCKYIWNKHPHMDCADCESNVTSWLECLFPTCLCRHPGRIWELWSRKPLLLSWWMETGKAFPQAAGTRWRWLIGE